MPRSPPTRVTIMGDDLRKHAGHQLQVDSGYDDSSTWMTFGVWCKDCTEPLQGTYARTTKKESGY